MIPFKLNPYTTSKAKYTNSHILVVKKQLESLTNWPPLESYVTVIFVSVLQPNTTFYLSRREALNGEYSYIEEKAVYINIIHAKTVQWKTRKQSCSIINIYI